MNRPLSRPVTPYPLIPLLIGLTSYLLALLIASDPHSALHWDAVVLWAVGLVTLLGGCRRSTERPALLHAVRAGKDWLVGNDGPALALVVAAVVLLRCLFLDEYPFFLYGDSIRDGGLLARELVDGTRASPLGWGSYTSYHRVLNIWNVAFNFVFGDQVRSIFYANATLCVLEAIVLFRLVSRWLGTGAAVLAGLSLACAPFSLGFARTETVIVFNSFWMTVLLWRFDSYLRRNDDRSLVILGLALGIAINFHSAVRAVAFVLIALLVAMTVLRRYRGALVPGEAARCVALLAATILVGMGPTLIYTDENLFHGGRHVFPDSSSINRIFHLYVASLMTYVLVSPEGHLAYGAPFVSMLVAPTFLLGCARMLFPGTDRLARLVGFLLLAIPFSNSAITDMALWDHRLSPVIPLCCLAVGYGFHFVSTLGSPLRRAAPLLAGLALVGFLAQSVDFFHREPLSSIPNGGASPRMTFLLGYLVRTAMREPALAGGDELCIGASPGYDEMLKLLHWQEAMRYHLRDRRWRIQVVPGLSSSELYLSRSCPADRGKIAWRRERYCETPEHFVCPPEDGALTLYVSP